MRNVTDFNRYFGLRWYDRLNRRVLLFFAFTASITLLSVLYIANRDYRRLDLITDEIIRQEYISTLEAYFPEQPPIAPPIEQPDIIVSGSGETAQDAAESAADRRARVRREIGDRLAGEGVLAELGSSDPYSDLPAVDDMVVFNEDDIIVDIEQTQNRGRLFSGNRSRNRLSDPGNIDDPMVTPFNYNLTRRGNVLIEFTDELIGIEEEVPRGYRDPEEIHRVVNHYRPMIEYCYNREAKHISGLRGYVKVKFSISYKGHVIPESIRIVNSTIRNRSVEQCIKKYIRRWRNFEELDESMGIAQVVQKFIFN